MIVEPAPTGRPGRWRRSRRALALVTPVALFAGVVAAGALGPKPAPVPTPRPPVAQASDAPAASPADAPAPSPSPTPVPSFPTVAADLAVLSIGEAAARIDAATSGPLAVEGWLDEVGAYAPCADAAGYVRGQLGPLCLRHARLHAGPEAIGPAAYLDITIAAGTRMPEPLEEAGGAGRRIPVVLVGHRGPRPDPCFPTTSECNGTIVVERVTWADGVPFDPGPVFDAYLEGTPPGWPLTNLESAETLAIGWSGTILQAALVRRSTVAAIEPAAARVMLPSPTRAQLVWWVLGLETGYDPQRHLHGSAPPRYSWVVLDYVTGDTLARGAQR